MLERLNRLGLPTKYAIVGFFGGLIGSLISWAVGLTDDVSYVAIPLGTALGGAVGGWLRQRRGRTS
jgi:hypothetical protein